MGKLIYKRIRRRSPDYRRLHVPHESIRRGVRSNRCRSLGGPSNGYVVMSQCTFGDIDREPYLAGAGGQQVIPVYTIGCEIYNAVINVSVCNGAIWKDLGSNIGLATQGSSYGAVMELRVHGSGAAAGMGTCWMNGSNLIGAGSLTMVYLATASNSVVRMQGCQIIPATASDSLIMIDNLGGSFYDDGGNTFTPNTGNILYSGSGACYGDGSITGVAQVSTNVALTNFGGSPTVTSVSGSSRLSQFTITVGTSPSGTGTMTVTFPTPFSSLQSAKRLLLAGTTRVSGPSLRPQSQRRVQNLLTSAHQ